MRCPVVLLLKPFLSTVPCRLVDLYGPPQRDSGGVTISKSSGMYSDSGLEINLSSVMEKGLENTVKLLICHTLHAN